MALAAYQPAEQVRDELARAIRSARNDCIPHETARQLLEYDHPGHTALVGIDRETENAVFYHEGDRYAIAVRFGPDRLAEGGAKIASLVEGPSVETWVKKMGPYWGWVHPRYRLIFDGTAAISVTVRSSTSVWVSLALASS